MIPTVCLTDLAMPFETDSVTDSDLSFEMDFAKLLSTWLGFVPN